MNKARIKFEELNNLVEEQAEKYRDSIDGVAPASNNPARMLKTLKEEDHIICKDCPEAGICCHCSGCGGHPVGDKTEEIRKLYYKEFPEESAGCDGCDLNIKYRNKIGDWWLQKLEEQRREIVDEYQTEYEQRHILGAIQLARQEIIDEVEKLRIRYVTNEDDTPGALEEAESHNQALDTVLSTINKER